MAEIVKQIILDVAKRNVFQAIIAKQNDNCSRFLNVRMVNEGETISIEQGSTVLINAKRSDGQSKSFAGVLNDDGTLTVPITSWILGINSIVKCDVSVIDKDGQKLTTTSFEIDVEASANPNDEISEDENYDILVDLIEQVDDAKTAAFSAATAANSAAEKFEEAIASLEKTQLQKLLNFLRFLKVHLSIFLKTL